MISTKKKNVFFTFRYIHHNLFIHCILFPLFSICEITLDAGNQPQPLQVLAVLCIYNNLGAIALITEKNSIIFPLLKSRTAGIQIFLQRISKTLHHQCVARGAE